MPTYGYRCQSCQREFDVWQRMTDEAVASCPTCGGSGKRQFFPAGLVFKGSGFYVTDNRRGAAAGNGSAKSESGKSDTGKSETGTPSTSDKPAKADSGSNNTSSKAAPTGTSSGAASGTSSE